MTKQLLILICLAALGAGVASPCRAQPPGAPLTPAAAAEEVESLLRACVQHMIDRKPAEAAQSAAAALGLSREAGDVSQQLRAANLLGLSLFRAGRTGEAVRRYAEAAAIAGRAGDAGGQALALMRAGHL